MCKVPSRKQKCTWFPIKTRGKFDTYVSYFIHIYLLDFFSEADNMQTTLLSPFLSEKLKDMGEVLLKNCSRYLLRA